MWRFFCYQKVKNLMRNRCWYMSIPLIFNETKPP
nr:MAG TPA: hypothetical protein [Caudoviricetes sp.]